MKWSIRIMTIIVLFLITGSILVSSKAYEKIFWSPLCLILLGVFTVIMMVCSFKQGLSLKKVGFQICHMGIVVILIGAGIGYFAGVKATAVFPMDTPYNQLQLEDGRVVDMGFHVSVIDFQVTRYNPDYYLYKPLEGNAKSDDLKDYENLGAFASSFDGSYDLKKYGRIDAQELRDSTARDGWCSKYPLENGLILVKAAPKDKHYLAKLQIIDSNNREIIEKLEVNHPVDYSGWRFYLGSYDSENNSYVVLTAKRDPGTALVIYGMWAVLFGTVILCFRKRNYLQGGESDV
ncbi:ResB-like family protein [Anaerobacterium chartisolvens]|uniref:ResB-like family protein n=1 Tax=Anaerobacterium chartisolvens TaxID=1297424 RepID=A0A369AGL4_9FIRM|nr:cytochrome c biogenesis protein ResB [Anaerobacterium chartisolvens]RCX08489.1 ResB-like family protein [Anaerobacterium chartisolvens]